MPKKSSLSISAPTSALALAHVIAVPDALPYMENGALVRLLPHWYADAGPISLYYANRTLLPAKTRAFVDFIRENSRKTKMAERFAGSLGPASY